MEKYLDHSMIKVTPDEIEKIREINNMGDVKTINEALDAVEDWIKKQDHLAEGGKYIKRCYLERMYMLAKGSVEGTKTKIDKLFTSRSLMPELCLHTSFKEFEKLLTVAKYIPVPHLNKKDLSRVILMKFSTKLDDFSLLEYFRLAFMLGEYRLNFEYCHGERYIVDLSNQNQLTFLSILNPVVMKKAEILCTEGYGSSIKGIHLLKAPSFVHKVVSILKSVLKEKVASRLFVHSSYEDLHKHVSREILPADYGGDEVSCDKLHEQWERILKTDEAAKIIANIDNLVSDESKRKSSTFNQEYLGMPGSFRKLNVD